MEDGDSVGDVEEMLVQTENVVPNAVAIEPMDALGLVPMVEGSNIDLVPKVEVGVTMADTSINQVTIGSEVEGVTIKLNFGQVSAVIATGSPSRVEVTSDDV
ncbi:hypothetical protein NE237_010958 [Protea cynaroides]|uniref:Uncharacterized protein n=1 Tax=Protea cynaroides TaxID=273540 RepID=A0A9Q0L0I6_9MAGN|nr:hypothetical protein NE237_010958 [Protea cynaroides]